MQYQQNGLQRQRGEKTKNACAFHRLYWTVPQRASSVQALSAQNENVLFCKVEMSHPFIAADLAFPSRSIVLHRVQLSRLPSGAVNGGLDGARPRCWGSPVMRGMAGLFWAVSETRYDRAFRGEADISTLLRQQRASPARKPLRRSQR
jgi:hypothetical protein